MTTSTTPSHGRANGPQGRSLARRTGIGLLRLALVALAVLSIEGAFRGALWIGGAPYRATETAAEMERIVSGMSDEDVDPGEIEDPLLRRLGRTRFLHPFHAWESRKGGYRREQAYLESLEQGALGPQAEAEDSDAEPVRVWVVGGSVAAQFATGHGAETLVEILEADPRIRGRKVVVDSCARGAFKQPQQVLVVAYRLSLGLEPDVIVNIDGFNEVAIAKQNLSHGVHPIYPSMPQWASVAGSPEFDPRLRDSTREIWRWQLDAVRQVDRTLRLGLHRSAIFGWVAMQRLRRTQTRWAEACSRQAGLIEDRELGPVVRGLPLDQMDDDTRAFAAMVEAWTEGSRCLDSICRSRSVPYVHVLQPTLHDEGSKVPTRAELEAGQVVKAWIDGVRIGYPLLREAGAALARQGIHFVDGSPLFRDLSETIYVDGCHFGDTGNAHLARLVAEELLPRLE